MKAIFAVTALAAAISGQALAADTESSTTFKGSMDAQFILNLQPEDALYDVELNADGDDDVGYEIVMSTAVTNGPFSGSVGITTREGASSFDIGDLVVTDGMLSFGQVGSLMATDEYTGGANNDMKDGNDLSVDVGFRYAVSDALKVQLQGRQTAAAATPAVTTATGVAAVYSATSGAISYVANAEMYMAGDASTNKMTNPYFAGVAATYTTDMLTVKAVFNSSLASGTTATGGPEAQTEYVLSAVAKVAGATLTGIYQEESSADDDESAKGEVAYAVGAITPSAGYLYTSAEKAGDELYAKVAHSANGIDSSAKVIMGNFDADDADAMLIELRVSTMSAVGVTYYGEYDMRAEATGTNTAAEMSKLTVGAKYAF